MAGTFTDFWRLVKPSPSKSRYVTSNSEAAKLYSNFSWYTKVMKGAASRFAKYNQFKNMDSDVFVHRALDTIAEEMTQTNARTNMPFEIVYQNENNQEVPDAVTMTVRAALRHWCEIQDLNTILFDIARVTIKFGDCFFRKSSDFRRWQFIDPSDMIGISIDDDGRPLHYSVREGEKNRQGAFGDVVMIPADGVVQFSLTSSMGENGPFGESVLTPTVKAYRHLSLLEDSVIIYRIVRAPERRVFFIDVGNMPPQRVKAYLESIRTELKQKRIPNETGGTDKVDSVYNPMSMTEDYFFAQTSNGRGSRVETLPGGDSLGEINDLQYFQNKFLQGLRIPASYMRGSSDGGAQITDGKVGIAYIEEVRFANYVARLQSKVNDCFDHHFKAYLKSAGIRVDPHLFKLKLVDPQNFMDYKQAEVDEKMIGNYSNVKDVPYLSERFKQKHYLGLSEDDIQENEVMLKQERGIPDGGVAPGLGELRMMYDPAWVEKRPDIKVSDDFDNFEEETKKDDDAESADEDDESSSGDEDQENGESGEKGEGGNEGEAAPEREEKGKEASGGSTESEEKAPDLDTVGKEIDNSGGEAK